MPAKFLNVPGKSNPAATLKAPIIVVNTVKSKTIVFIAEISRIQYFQLLN